MCGLCQELVARFHEFGMADTAAVLQEHVEAGSVTQFEYRRRREGEHHRVAEGEEVLLGTLGQGEHTVLLGALAPRLEHDERHTRALAAAGEVEAVDGEHRCHGVGLFLQQVLTHLVNHNLRTFGTGAGRGLYLGKQYALVFFREEGSRDAGEQPDHADHDQRVAEQERHLVAQDGAHAALVAVYAAVEVAVEPAKEPAFGGVVLTFLQRLEHGGAQCRGEDKRYQHREAHGRHDGDGELPVDHTCGTTEERHGQQYRRQYQGNTHQGALDLFHRTFGRLLGR
ncbi:hypothetical protein D3C76_1045320 [compost metagenome]